MNRDTAHSLQQCIEREQQRCDLLRRASAVDQRQVMQRALSSQTPLGGAALPS